MKYKNIPQNRCLNNKEGTVLVRYYLKMKYVLILCFMFECFRVLTKYRQARDLIPDLLGMASYRSEPALVFKGDLRLARETVIGKRGSKQLGRMHRTQHLATVVKPFIIDVTRAVEFLHLRKLVHIALSLDTVYLTPQVSLVNVDKFQSFKCLA